MIRKDNFIAVCSKHRWLEQRTCSLFLFADIPEAGSKHQSTNWYNHAIEWHRSTRIAQKQAMVNGDSSNILWFIEIPDA